MKAVIAESYERIHRSNLLMMGVLPLQFLDGETPTSLGLTGRETFSIIGVENGEAREVTVRADDKEFRARVRLDTPARARVPPARRDPPVHAAPSPRDVARPAQSVADMPGVGHARCQTPSRTVTEVPHVAPPRGDRVAATVGTIHRCVRG